MPEGFFADAEVQGDMRDRAAGGADLADGPLAELLGVLTWCCHGSWFSFGPGSKSLASGTPRNRGQLREGGRERTVLP